MVRILSFVLVLALAGCAGVPSARYTTASACANGEATDACQVERYRNAN